MWEEGDIGFKWCNADHNLTYCWLELYAPFIHPSGIAVVLFHLSCRLCLFITHFLGLRRYSLWSRCKMFVKAFSRGNFLVSNSLTPINKISWDLIFDSILCPLHSIHWDSNFSASFALSSRNYYLISPKKASFVSWPLAFLRFSRFTAYILTFPICQRKSG